MLRCILDWSDRDPKPPDLRLLQAESCRRILPRTGGRDGGDIPFDVYRIKTRITQSGAPLEVGQYVDKRDRESRAKRWERLGRRSCLPGKPVRPSGRGRGPAAPVVRKFRDELFTEIFPGRVEVPKTLVYAEDDPHADDLVQIIREEFGERETTSARRSPTERREFLPSSSFVIFG